MASFTDERALELALVSRSRHGVDLDGTCLHCVPGTRWPCGSFERAQRVIRLAIAEEPASMSFLCADEYLQTQPISAAWLEGRS